MALNLEKQLLFVRFEWNKILFFFLVWESERGGFEIEDFDDADLCDGVCLVWLLPP